MYSSFYNFKVDPFAETPDTRFYFKSSGHIEALKKLTRALLAGKGFIQLTGEVGTGKTILSRFLIKNCQDVVDFALLLRPHYDSAGLIWALGEEFGLIPVGGKGGQQSQALLSGLVHHFFENARHGKKSVIIVDESQTLSLEALETIRLLSNLECETEKVIQIILIGQPELEQKLSAYSFRQINQRISTRISLPSFQLHETASYIKHRIEIAQGANHVGLSMQTIEYIHKHSQGIPRLINLYCSSLLTQGEIKGLRYIDLKEAKSFLKKENVLIKGFLSDREKAHGKDLQL